MGTIHLRQVARDKTLFVEGDTPSLVAVLRSGFLRRERILTDGRRSLLSLVVPGDIVGALVVGRASYSLESATDAELCSFDPGRVRQVLENAPLVRREILQTAARQHDRQLAMVWQRGALTSRERVIAFLVTAADIMPVEPLPDGSLIVTVELSRRDWADLSNTTVETISRTLGQLAEKQMVRAVAPGRYWIRDLALLAALAGLEQARSPLHVGVAAPSRPCESPASTKRLTAVNAHGSGQNRI